MTVFVSIIHGINHMGYKGQGTRGSPYPKPPPLGVVFLQQVTTGGIGVLSVSYSLWGVLSVSSIPLSNILLVVGGIYFFKNFSGSQIIENYQRQ